VLFHLHTPYATALGSLAKLELLPIHQDSLRYIHRFAVYKEYGIAHAMEEGHSIGNAFQGNKDVLFMANHGTMVAAPNCHIAFDDWYLEADHDQQ